MYVPTLLTKSLNCLYLFVSSSKITCNYSEALQGSMTRTSLIYDFLCKPIWEKLRCIAYLRGWRDWVASSISSKVTARVNRRPANRCLQSWWDNRRRVISLAVVHLLGLCVRDDALSLTHAGRDKCFQRE